MRILLKMLKVQFDNRSWNWLGLTESSALSMRQRPQVVFSIVSGWKAHKVKVVERGWTFGSRASRFTFYPLAGGRIKEGKMIVWYRACQVIVASCPLVALLIEQSEDIVIETKPHAMLPWTVFFLMRLVYIYTSTYTLFTAVFMIFTSSRSAFA